MVQSFPELHRVYQSMSVKILYDINDKVILDPDQQVQTSLHLAFETFLLTGNST
ncbi:MAG: hypothetical protein ABIJ59_13165 [Pseudomonadota bacterium]